MPEASIVTAAGPSLIAFFDIQRHRVARTNLPGLFNTRPPAHPEIPSLESKQRELMRQHLLAAQQRMQAAFETSQSDDGLLVVHGPRPGSGKNVLAHAIAQDIVVGEPSTPIEPPAPLPQADGDSRDLDIEDIGEDLLD